MRVLAAAVFLVTLVAGGSAAACSCLRADPAEGHLASSQAALVFKGRVIGTRSFGDGSAATTFRLQDVLRGRAGRTVVIEHAVDSAACGVSFVPGRSVLVLANRRAPETQASRWSRRRDAAPPLSTSLCSQPHFPEADYRRALSRAIR